jgi:hypothetical protein
MLVRIQIWKVDIDRFQNIKKLKTRYSEEEEKIKYSTCRKPNNLSEDFSEGYNSLRNISMG